MMAPMPSATSDAGPSVRFRVASPLRETSVRRPSIDLFRNNEPATISLAVFRLSFDSAVRPAKGQPHSVRSRLYAAAHVARGGISSARERPDAHFREKRHASQQRRTLPQQFLIEVLADDHAGDLGGAKGSQRTQHGALAEGPTPEHHVAEVEVPCIPH